MSVDTAWDDLDGHLADIDGLDDPTGMSDEMADRVIRHVARHRRQLAADEAVASAEIDRIREWLGQRRAAHDTSSAEESLARYHAARLERDRRAKTLHLPSGTLTARRQPDRWEFDEDAFVAWAAGQRRDLLRERVEIDKPVAKKLLRATDAGVVDTASGELVPGVSVHPGEVSYAVKTGDDQ